MCMRYEGMEDIFNTDKKKFVRVKIVSSWLVSGMVRGKGLREKVVN